MVRVRRVREHKAWACSSALAAVCVCVTVGLLAGCSSPGKDTGTVVNYSPEENRKKAEARAEEIKNNPNIPEGQKQMILGRMKGMQSNQSGEASVLSKQGKSGPGAPAAPAPPGPK